MFEDLVAYVDRTTPYIAMNWALAVLATICLIGVYRSARYLFVKPSMMVLGFYHVLLQWPAAIFSEYYEKYLPNPWVLAMLVHGFMLIGLVISASTLHAPAKEIWGRITRPSYLAESKDTSTVFIVGAIVVLLTLYYLSAVPLNQTGLYAIFLNPLEATEAREAGLKLLANRSAAYAYLFMALSVAPVMVALVHLDLLRCWRGRRYFGVAFRAVGIVMLLMAASLSGARSLSVNLLLVMAITYVFLRGVPFKPLYAMAGLAVILLPAAILSVLREGKEADAALFIEYLLRNVADRVFVTPVNTGSWYVHWQQTVGEFGIGGVPKLARMLGVEPLEVTNIIGLKYETNPLASISTVTGYVFSYYSYFGWISLPICLVGLWFTDIAIPFLRRLPDALLLPCLAALARSSLAFADTDYTIAWVTQGFGIILILCVSVGWTRAKFRLLPPRPQEVT